MRYGTAAGALVLALGTATMTVTPAHAGGLPNLKVSAFCGNAPNGTHRPVVGMVNNTGSAAATSVSVDYTVEGSLRYVNIDHPVQPRDTVTFLISDIERPIHVWARIRSMPANANPNDGQGDFQVDCPIISTH